MCDYCVYRQTMHSIRQSRSFGLSTASTHQRSTALGRTCEASVPLTPPFALAPYVAPHLRPPPTSVAAPTQRRPSPQHHQPTKRSRPSVSITSAAAPAPPLHSATTQPAQLPSTLPPPTPKNELYTPLSPEKPRIKMSYTSPSPFLSEYKMSYK